MVPQMDLKVILVITSAPAVPAILENQMEMKTENAMEAGFIPGLWI